MENKQAFEDYLNKIVQQKTTVKQYSNSIDEVSQKYQNKLAPEYTSIFEISDINVYDKIRDKIKNASTFKSWNNLKDPITKKQLGKAGFPLAAMNRYMDFLVNEHPKIKAN